MKAADRQAEIAQLDSKQRALDAEANALMKTRRPLPAIRKHIQAQIDAAHQKDSADHLAALVSIADGGSTSLLVVNLSIETASGPVQASLDLAPLLTRLLGKEAVFEALIRPITNGAGGEAIRHSPRAEAIEEEVRQLQARRDELAPDEASKDPTAEEFQAYAAAMRGARAR